MLTQISTPFTGANPFGENINYDPDFDVLKNEIGKMGNTDYDLIEEKSITILKGKAKDLRVMAFFSFALLRKENWENFADVFDGMASLMEQNYDAVQPDRDRAKQMALKWISEDRFNALLEEKKPTEKEYDHVVRLVSGLSRIKPILEQKFPEGSPFPSNLYKFAQQWEKACKPKPVAAPPPPPPPQVSSTPAGEGSVVAPVSAVSSSQPSGSADPMDTPKQAQGIVRKAASFLIEKEPQKPMGYRLMRSLRWDILEKAPPAEGGKTQLAPPQPQQRAFFVNLLGQKDWKQAFEKAEAAFLGGANHLWLDLQRISAQSCKELGESYASIRQAVLLETAYLLKRIPDLVSLSFSDGSAFCDDATRDWINAEVLTAFGSGGGTVVAAGGSGDPVDEDLKKANAMSAAGQVEEALDYIQNGMRTSASERDNFRRSIIVGTLLLKAKQPDIAVSVLESLDQKISLYNLDKWEPDLAVEAWGALLAAIKVGKIQKPQNILIAMTEKQNTILSKISQIDPRKAFQLNK